MQDVVANALRQQRTGATLLGAVALGSLLLAAMGIFGVVAASVRDGITSSLYASRSGQSMTECSVSSSARPRR